MKTHCPRDSLNRDFTVLSTQLEANGLKQAAMVVVMMTREE
jgi:hypothetical protein